MPRLPKGYKITRADPEEVDALISINLASDTLFANTGLVPVEDLGEHIPASIFLDAISARDVFVARHGKAEQPVGFTLTSERGGTLYLDQISVHPDHGRKGLGRALVKRVLEDARDRGLKQVTLSTFRDVAWNGPFYRSLGFRPVAVKKMAAWMQDLESAQAETLDVSKRHFMQKRVRLF
ncbi:MAG: GNAT family N-acetyltransferase [Hyphomonadaceae bacterium]|nr:GNAT family N-acetyltransferase [Hyphomonadaceae bacterium]